MVEEMTPRERVRIALNHKEPDRVPVTLGGSANHLTEQRYELLRDHFGVKDIPRRTLVGFYSTPDYNPVLDKLSGNPFMRKVVQRLPLFLRPKAVSYGHIIAIDGKGNILEDLQDPHGKYPMNTSVIETKDYLYIGSLVAPFLARLSKKRSGLLL